MDTYNVPRRKPSRVLFDLVRLLVKNNTRLRVYWEDLKRGSYAGGKAIAAVVWGGLAVVVMSNYGYDLGRVFVLFYVLTLGFGTFVYHWREFGQVSS